MTKIAQHLPDTYLTDGQTLYWVIERTGQDKLLVENAATLEQLEMGDADLAGYKVVEHEAAGEPKGAVGRSKDRGDVRDNRPSRRSVDPRSDRQEL